MRPTPETLDAEIRILQEHKDRWARLSLPRRLDYLDCLIEGYVRVAAGQAAACNQAKGIPLDSPLSAEEWVHPVLVVRLLRLLRDTLRQIHERGGPQLPRNAVRVRPNGQVVVQVFPSSRVDQLFYRGFRGEVWMQPGVTEANLSEHLAGFYRRSSPSGAVALVLGAGNVASVGASDLIHKLFVEGRVVLYKHNPVNAYLAPFLAEAFAPLIRDGYVRMVEGQADTGEYLCQHPGIDEIHLTGSDRTFEAIVFGPGTAGLERKRQNQPRLAKPVTCELGNVSPIIVMPGAWSEADLAFHSENVATQVTVNCGFNCLSGRVLILPREWPQAARFLERLRAVFAAAPQRPAYYPGAEARYDQLLAGQPRAEPIGPRRPGILPYTLVPDLDPEDRDSPWFATECFLPVLAQTSLPGRDPADYLGRAVAFCNGTLWGTLSACLIIHPQVARTLGQAQLENAVADLRYGSVGVNHWPALSYLWGSTPWGAWPGHTAADIQSGIGFVHNTFLFDRPQKSVMHGPFRIWPRPPWFLTHRRMHQVFPKMVGLEANPSLFGAVRVAWPALRG